jgi:hypothetical protein
MTGISTAAQSAVWSREEDMADLLAGGISVCSLLAAFGGSFGVLRLGTWNIFYGGSRVTFEEEDIIFVHVM